MAGVRAGIMWRAEETSDGRVLRPLPGEPNEWRTIVPRMAGRRVRGTDSGAGAAAEEARGEILRGAGVEVQRLMISRKWH